MNPKQHHTKDNTPDAPDEAGSSQEMPRRNFLKILGTGFAAGAAGVLGTSQKAQGQINTDELLDPQARRAEERIEKSKEKQQAGQDWDLGMGIVGNKSANVVLEGLGEVLRNAAMRELLGGIVAGGADVSKTKGAVESRTEKSLSRLADAAESPTNETPDIEEIEATLNRLKNINKQQLRSARFRQEVYKDIGAVLDFIWYVSRAVHNPERNLYFTEGRVYGRILITFFNVLSGLKWFKGTDRIKAVHERADLDVELLADQLSAAAQQAKTRITAAIKKAEDDAKKEEEAKKEQKDEERDKRREEKEDKRRLEDREREDVRADKAHTRTLELKELEHRQKLEAEDRKAQRETEQQKKQQEAAERERKFLDKRERLTKIEGADENDKSFYRDLGIPDDELQNLIEKHQST